MLAIVAALVFVWFYRSALAYKVDNAFAWALGGIVAFYATGIFWVYVILKPMIGHEFSFLSPMNAVWVEISGIGVALIPTYLVKTKLLAKKAHDLEKSA